MHTLQRSELAIVIPAYNEALTIESVVKAVSIYGQAIVVDDCSTDETSDLASTAGALVISHTNNGGYDCALNSGIAKANHLGIPYAITFDADGQHNAEIILQYIKSFEDGCELVLGVRPVTARWAEYCFAIYTHYRFGVNDPLCGMKGYNLNLYKEYGCFDSYQSIGTELMLYALKSGTKKIQIQVPISPRLDNPRFDATFRANIKILRAMIIGFLK